MTIAISFKYGQVLSEWSEKLPEHSLESLATSPLHLLLVVRTTIYSSAPGLVSVCLFFVVVDEAPRFFYCKDARRPQLDELVVLLAGYTVYDMCAA